MEIFDHIAASSAASENLFFPCYSRSSFSLRCTVSMTLQAASSVPVTTYSARGSSITSRTASGPYYYYSGLGNRNVVKFRGVFSHEFGAQPGGEIAQVAGDLPDGRDKGDGLLF